MKTDLKHIDDILKSCIKILKYSKGVGEEAFLKNDQLQDAVISRITQIGEAANRLPDPIREKHSDINWTEIRRN